MNNLRRNSRSSCLVWGLLGTLITVIAVFLLTRRSLPPPGKTGWDKSDLPGLSRVLSGTARRPVRLFFPGPERELATEEREIRAAEKDVDGMRQILILLLSGPRSGGLFPLMPEGAALRELYFHDGIVYVDLAVSREVPAASGCLEESLVLESIRRTLTGNFPAVDRVRVLLNGQERKTLAGHIALE